MRDIQVVSKGRSPRYPRISLETAIGYARRLYDEAHRSQVDPDTAARLMGFSGKSGASAIALGAVRQFGLVDGLRGSLKVSDLAMKILQPSSVAEAEDARSECAFKPEVYDRLVGHFDGQLPRSDEPIKAHLIRVMGFSQAGAEECVGTLRRTLEELEAFSLTARREEPVSAPPAESIETLSPHLAAAKPPETSQGELVRIPLSKECTAELKLIGKIDRDSIDRLIQYIELMKGVWAE